MTKTKILNINHTFKKNGKITCRVTSGSVTIQLNGGNAVIYNAENQGNGSSFSKTKNDDNSRWNVKVSRVGDKAAVVFTAPDPEPEDD